MFSKYIYYGHQTDYSDQPALDLRLGSTTTLPPATHMSRMVLTGGLRRRRDSEPPVALWRGGRDGEM